MLHDPAGELAPETVLDFLVGLGLTQLLEGQRVDPLAENAENRGKNRDGRDRGKHDGSNGAVSHRFEARSEEHTSELQSLMRISYAVFCLKKKINKQTQQRADNITTQHSNNNTT